MARQTQLDLAIEKINGDIVALEKEISVLQRARDRLIQHRLDDANLKTSRRQYTTKADQV